MLGLVLVAALGLKRGASTPAGKAALGLGKAVPGPVGTVSRAASGSGGRTTTRRPRAAPDPDTEAFQQGRRQAIRRQGRETEHSRITGARSRASDDRERREGFPGYTS